MVNDCDICEFLRDKPLRNQIITTDHWTVGIIPDQAYLGRVLKSRLGQLDHAQWQEFEGLIPKLEYAYGQAFGTEPLNIGNYMNDAYQAHPPHPHVHWHIFPRYKEPAEVHGITFEDKRYGHFYDDNAKRIVDQEVVAEIVERLRQYLAYPRVRVSRDRSLQIICYTSTMIQAIIFDMDGLLIDSEPLWKDAEVQVFTQVGVPLTVAMTAQTTGLRTDEVVQHWHRQYPWDSPSQKAVEKQIDEIVLELIKSKGEPKKGALEVISACEKLGLPLAIASSSSTQIIEAVVSRLGIKIIHSAEFEPFGKPHPAVYLSAAKKLGVDPHACLTFEDSVNGFISAKAARMRCIAVPEPGLRDDKRYGIADTVVDSLLDVTTAMIQDR